MAQENQATPSAQTDEQNSQQLFGKRLARRIVAPVVVALVAYVLLLLYGDAPLVIRNLRHLPASACVLGVSIAVFSLAVRGLRWHLYLRVIKLEVPALDSALIFCCISF